MANTSTLDINVFENVHGLLTNLTGTLTKANTAVVTLTSSVNTLAGSFSQTNAALQKMDSTAEKASDKILGFFSSLVGGAKSATDSLIYLNNLDQAVKNLGGSTTLVGKVVKPVMDGISKGLQVGVNAFNVYRTQVVAARAAVSTTTGAVKLLNIAIASSGWGLAIAGVTALCVGIYKLMEGASEASKHYNKLNESLAEMESNVVVEEMNLERLFRMLNKTKEGTEEWNKIRNQINNRYGEYLQNMGIEIQNAKDAKIAYDGLKKSIYEVNRLKFAQKALEEADEKYGEVYGESRSNIRQAIINQVGGDREKGSQLFNELMEKYGTQEKYSNELKKVMFSFSIPSLDPFNINSIFKLLNAPGYNEEVFIDLKKLHNNKRALEEAEDRIYDVYGVNPEDLGRESRKKSTFTPTVLPNSENIDNKGLKSGRDHSNFILSAPSLDQQLWQLPQYSTSPMIPVSDPMNKKAVNINNNVTLHVSNSNGQSGENLGTQFAQAFINEVSESLTSLV